ncbi:Maltose operon transcriptional repressor MalR, LacI family [Granulicella sibirica]|uniref:Maltose operon transcriptional repressor MalR, LacI family n=1 Tax=Granulicella sibirica TaxID=2479048 RepID=A0A4Q0T2N3_9BACT|nr:Maltose operon transcriptional repressor MalR, LacI family [Granulicella sibirica]
MLSGSPAARSIPAVTQERIFEAARKFQYRPNVLARSLRSQKSLTIGVMVPEVSEGYATLVLSGIEQKLLEEGYFYFVVSHHHRQERIAKYMDLLLARAVEGIIAVDTPLEHPLTVPTVVVSGHREPEGTINIRLNHKLAAELALDHLIELGHRKIAIIKGQVFSSDTQIRWKSIVAAAKRRGLVLDSTLVEQLDGLGPGNELGYAATRRLLEGGRQFSALFAFNDSAAIGAMKALVEAGLKVPGDVSVVGFDDVQGAAFQSPGLTTVVQPLREMGSLAASTLLDKILGRPTPSNSKVWTVDPGFVVRGSTGPLPDHG